ncbi:MAG: hypothetical protein IH959_04825 [Chloroflexi bacterium]|nr:hypothetical protein [Chloroflexota bacterium]
MTKPRPTTRIIRPEPVRLQLKADATVSVQAVRPMGIASAEAFGMPTVIVGGDGSRGENFSPVVGDHEVETGGGEPPNIRDE